MDGKDFSYRSLIVWQKALQFAKIVYAVIDMLLIKKYHPLSNSNSLTMTPDR